MKRKEAISQLKSLYDHCENMKSGDNDFPVWKNDCEALSVAISALRPVSREQVEKVWRGEWLNFYNDFSTAECSKCGELFDVSDTDENLKVLFDAFKKYYRFCPSCGAPMTDEAVELVMERMEALYEQKV